MNDEAVNRTAPATPGLLNRIDFTHGHLQKSDFFLQQTM